MFDITFDVTSWISLELFATAPAAAAITAAGFNSVRFGDSKLSSSSSSIGLFGVMETVSLKHKQAQ